MSNSLAHPSRYYSAEELQQQQMMSASSNVLRPSVDGPKCPAPAPANAGESRFASMHPPVGPVRTVVYPGAPLSHDDGFTQNTQLSKIATKDAPSSRANATTRIAYPPEKSADARPTNALPMIHLTHSDYDKILKDAYAKGIRAGYAQGRVAGYQDALKLRQNAQGGMDRRGTGTSQRESAMSSSGPYTRSQCEQHVDYSEPQPVREQLCHSSSGNPGFDIPRPSAPLPSLPITQAVQPVYPSNRFITSDFVAPAPQGSRNHIVSYAADNPHQPPDEGARMVQSDRGNGYPTYGGHFIG